MPVIWVVSVADVCAAPKSVILMSFSPDNMMLAGLMSR